MADGKIKVSEIRKQFPMYGSVPDDQLLIAVRKKYYPEMAPGDFISRIEFDTRNDPNEGRSDAERFVIGAGKGFMDLARGAGQAVGAVSRDDIAESRRLDKPLMDTGAGYWGSVAGTVAGLAPAMFIPGANTYAGASAIGAGTGLLAPSESTGETLMNTAVGGALAPAAQALGRGIGSTWQAGKGLVAPFFEKGQDKIAARTLRAYSSARKPQEVTQLADTLANAPASKVPGMRPTVPELVEDPGLSNLYRTLQNNPEAGRELGGLALANQQARAAAVGNIAGSDAQRAAAVASREALAKDAYQAATQANYTVDDALGGLLKRPTVREAVGRAERLAADDGRKFSFTVGDPAAPEKQITGQGLQDLKMALDQMLSDPTTGFAGKAGDAVRNIRKQLVAWMEEKNPAFKAAREGYRDASQPINQMDIGRTLLERLQKASGATGENGELFSRALNSGDDLARSATGWKGARLDTSLTPEAAQMLQAVKAGIAGQANANNLGRGVGSPTGQNFVSQNFLRQIAGPMGLPSSWAESTLLESLLRPVQWAAKAGEQRITPKLANALMDPVEAARLLRLAEQQGLLERAGRAAVPTFGPAATGAYLASPPNR